MRHNGFIKALALLSVFFVFIGCGQQVTRIDLTITSGRIVNPDPNDLKSDSRPLVLRFYELAKIDINKNIEKTRSGFEKSISNPAEYFGDAPLSQTKHVILQNKIQSYKIRFNEKAKYLAIVGSFRELDREGHWKYIIDLEVGERNDADLYIDKYSIRKAD
jgi:type VI secretion system VasD/TssJ family lipoprotein